MNTFGMVYNKHKHCYEPIYVEKTKDEKAKIAFIMSMQDREAKEQYKLEHRNGYCPHCHMLIPLSGCCDCQK